MNSYTLGEQLRNLRSEGRVTLHEVSRDTKIPMKYLEKIESGCYEELPPDVYVKGFLRAYAEFLGVDPKKIISLYEREKEIKSNLCSEEKKTPVKKAKKPASLVITPRYLAVAVIVIAIVGGFSYLYNQVGRFAAVPRLVITSPASDESVPGNSISVSGFTDEDAKLTINGQPVLVSDRGEFKEDILLQNGVNAVTISAENRFEKKISKILNIKSDYQAPEVANGGDENGKVIGEQDEKREGVNITVRADANPVWISVEADGNLVYSGTMLPGAVQDFKGDKEVRITSGKANQTFIKVNGKDEKVLADTPGIVRDVVFGPND
ncbi:MAG: DUF4115 domain-containing protein [Candidatus Moranbacteria bacterium]|nr:DUF4115 domain-containing protein [Candidatus Moranbacteria bacterium]